MKKINWKEIADGAVDSGCRCPVWLNATFINEACADVPISDSDTEAEQLDKFYNAVYRAVISRKPGVSASVFYSWMQTAMEEREGL